VSSVKIAIILKASTSNPLKKLLGWLAHVFTRCDAYHIGFVAHDPKSRTTWFIDQHMRLRSRRAAGLYKRDQVELYDPPFPVTLDDLSDELLTQDDSYGWLDYLRFGLRPLFHLFGASTVNLDGRICSEWVRDVGVRRYGWTAPWAGTPSPCDWRRALRKYAEGSG